ncbi:glycerol-3-phosphate 1-O-acyltransferase [Leptolyngbyaceae cyanobacterium CCMR0082]|uniref:Glycerol-3-phosphate acyltransferase n=2 Tax=Adonisia turfae TaxID=2950184 RepID=A0A6M0S9X6_9CYAN|nr:glycerol-3-phosphate 1-O-acyltransferase PlsY [Adonisia turfae]MDV3350082.1 glycerol-3-phosphate 1-O-acyltransferase PlsY [Leptothoe sp. LEGE 181152]NEZ59155.1 glycerol-3-phosphate 1-O-acyltransferase [Adonisia turfae CCMR0081]NEZ65294.1 glycerol-3-phosphate 1-O-acyltransferase [Adonisia turfae CCMR0082]
MVWWIAVGLLVLAYLLGSLPTGYVVAKLLKGIDIREHGSGNTGATNVFRVVGKQAGITVLVIDLLKGLTAVLIARFVMAQFGDSLTLSTWIQTLAGLLAILGHSRSVWLNFTGGKSAATGLGVILALAWPVGLGTAAVFGLVFGLSRTVSLGSISAATAAPILMFLTGQPLPFILLVLLGGIYVIIRHRSNISRLLAGTEPKLGNS